MRLVLALLLTGPLMAADPDFTVARGQLTFDAEGREGGRFHSRKAHVPGDTSGVTIGRGYDLKLRKASDVVRDLVAAGLPEADAKEFAKGVDKKGNDARKFVKDAGLPEISAAVQKKLFEATYAELEDDVKRICAKADVVKAYGKTDWEKLHPAIRDLLVDLRYRGDYTGTTRKLVQPAVAANNLKAFVAAIREEANWPGVPEGRVKARKAFADAAK